jgi:hypothetical protein
MLVGFGIGRALCCFNPGGRPRFDQAGLHLTAWVARARRHTGRSDHLVQMQRFTINQVDTNSRDTVSGAPASAGFRRKEASFSFRPYDGARLLATSAMFRVDLAFTQGRQHRGLERSTARAELCVAAGLVMPENTH